MFIVSLLDGGDKAKYLTHNASNAQVCVVEYHFKRMRRTEHANLSL
jgi:hypothetical protein